MFNTFTPSKLLRIYKGIYLRNSFFKVDKYLALTLLDLYENDSLPILKIFSYRQVINRIKRWREWIDMIIYIYKVRIRKLPIYRIWSELKISK